MCVGVQECMYACECVIIRSGTLILGQRCHRIEVAVLPETTVLMPKNSSSSLFCITLGNQSAVLDSSILQHEVEDFLQACEFQRSNRRELGSVPG